MGLIGEKWRCPKCNVDVGGSMGELRNHMKKAHAPARPETRIAAA
jgi:hypothetical protein